MVMVSIAHPSLDEKALRIALDGLWAEIAKQRSGAAIYIMDGILMDSASLRPKVRVPRSERRAWLTLNRGWRKTHK